MQEGGVGCGGAQTKGGRVGWMRMESLVVGGSVDTKTTWVSLFSEDYTPRVASFHTNLHILNELSQKLALTRPFCLQ